MSWQSAVGLLLLPCLVLAHAPVAAQTRVGAPGRARFTPSIRGFGTAGITIFSAADSFKAVFDSSTGPLIGGGVEVGVTRHLFASFAVSRFARTGRRLFTFEDRIFDLHEPTRVRITPLELSLGYRHALTPRWLPAVSGGISWYRYSETSPGATETEDAHDTFGGYHVAAGIERPVRRWLSLAGEGQFASAPHALGQSPTGVSNLYDEHDLGGLTLRVKVIVGR